MHSSHRERTLVLLLLGLAVLWLGNQESASEPTLPPACARPVLVEGAVARAGLTCDAETVSAAILGAGGVTSCRESRVDTRVLRAGDAVRVGEGEREACVVRLGLMPGPLRLAVGLRLPLNAASADDLRALPGVGLGMAARIVAHRTQHGPFARIESLRAVRGVGPKRLRAWRPHLELHAPARAPPRSAQASSPSAPRAAAKPP